MSYEFHAAVLIAVMSLVTIFLRALPFLVFSGRRIPDTIRYLGDVLPPAVMGMLVVYCLRSVSIVRYPHGLPEFISCLLVAVLQVWRRNSLLSILAGTIAYMIFLRCVF